MQFRNGSLLLAGCASVLCAQTYIVDAANGPGTHFTDIATAAAVVPDGAVLDVRPGNYGSFTIANKGLSVLCASGVTVSPVVPVTVTGTAPQQVIVLRGLRVPLGDLSVSACQGPVLLYGCTIGEYPNGAGQLLANGCMQLHADNCSFANPLQFLSAVMLDNCVAVFRACTGGSSYLTAMDLRASSVQLTDCVLVRGGLSLSSIVTVAGASVRIVGGWLQGGAPSNACISGTGSVRVDPGVAHQAPLFSGTLQSSIVEMPAVITAGGALGSFVTATMRGPSGDVGALLVGLPGPPLQVPGFADAFWLQPGTQAVCAFTVFAAGVPLAVTYAVPNAPAMYGMRFGWQGASSGAMNGLQASNPAITTHW